ncbi:MAG: efflux RND transporter periplasmic adaptor subunit, partial [Flavobacteriales bacterium]
MKKYINLILVFCLGLVVSYFLFGNKTQHSENHKHTEEKVEQWTCSMHPQIVQNQAGDCPICAMDLVPLSSTESQDLDENQFKMTAEAQALAQVETYRITEEKSKGKTLTISGQLTENETNKKSQISNFSGRLEEFFVHSEGEQVKKGQKIASIYSPDLITAQQELILALDLEEGQSNLVESIRKKLKNFQLTTSQIQEIETSKKIQTNFPIYAQYSGIISEVLVQEGEQISKGKTLYKSTDYDKLWAEFDVYENDISSFKVGQRLRIKVDAFPQVNILTNVSFIDPVLDTKHRQIKVRAEIGNVSSKKLKPGLFLKAYVSLKSDHKKEQIRVPKTAVLWTGKRSVVYLKSNENSDVFEQRTVELGESVGDFYEIKNGLFIGNEVVSKGTFVVDASAQLLGKPSMMNQNNLGDYVRAELKEFPVKGN